MVFRLLANQDLTPMLTIQCFEVYTTVGKWFLKFTSLCLIEIVLKLTSSMRFFTHVTRRFTIFFQKTKKLAKLFKLL